MNKPKKQYRHLSGIFLLDKAQGISSNKALQQVRHAFEAKKAGHTGTLDPMATGLLPICLGEATKFSNKILSANKGYTATLQLGESTDTGDADGTVLEKNVIPNLTTETVNMVLKSFLGKQKQIPPMYSALKKDGKKLYELAREGITVNRPAREIEIEHISLKNIKKQSIEIEVICSKGTYIRVLGEDIANKLNTVGHLTALRRTQTACFDINAAISFEYLEKITTLENKDALLLPIDSFLQHYKKINLDEQQTQRLKLGQRLNVFTQSQELINSMVEESIEVRLYHEDLFVGMGLLEKTGRLQPKKMVNYSN